MPPAIVVLGPQRHKPTLLPAMEAMGVGGTVAAVTAGWEEREAEVERLESHLGTRVVNLELHRRGEDVLGRDREFLDAWRLRRERLREHGEVYRRRLGFLVRSVRELLRRKGEEELVGPDREAAIEDVRRLDDLRLRRVEAIEAEFEERWRPGEREAIAAHRAEVAAVVEEADAVVIAGGNVAVLLNRLRLFGLPALLPGRPLFAWSAGAMALTDRVVLFHDDPPIGVGNAEVMGAGLGLVPGVVLLPHAHRRLRLQDRVRTAVFALRFAPSLCVAMEDGSALACRGRRRKVLEPGLAALTTAGALEPLGAP
ncbi:MAG: Type 1 glutamine amidotransferase-like domain-containing protein [Planctomycetaceae bacterium]|nr:Type 1 glutamine amidotransferase-like domain-containing protein [Planctomycetota bacterium]NUN51440.1 Type 1 glutamine amidotransferase-like domain-containing protein [Planctomycetaceae bacterium]